MNLLLQISDPNLNVTTTTGIVAVAFLLTEVVKRLVKTTTPVIGKIPIIFIPILFSMILTLFANLVMKRNDGTPFLMGNIWVLLGNSIVLASSASGFYDWLRNGGRTTGEAIPLGQTTEQQTPPKIPKPENKS